MAIDSQTLRAKWARHTLHTSVALLVAGSIIEVAVVALIFVCKFLIHAMELSANGYFPPEYLYLSISLAGFFGSLILVYGVLSLIRGFRISKSAERWVYAAIVIFVSFKGFDILQTWRHQYLTNLFGLSLDLDTMVSNILLVGSALTVLVGMLRALYDANQSSRKLEAQYTLLDRGIRERQKSEAQARTSEERLAAILNALSAPIFLCDKNGYILAHNKVFSDFFGSGPAALTGRHVRALFSEPVYEIGKANAARVMENNHAQNFTLHHDDCIWDVNVYPVQSSNEAAPSVTVLATDITDKLRNEQERRLLETAINDAAESILITDAEGRIEYVNPAFEEQTGYARQEAMGRTPALLKSGKQDARFYRELWQTIKQGEVWRGRFVNRRKDGELFHENATISPIISEEGVITHYVAVKRNVTREHQLEQQLQQAQRIEALGTLAGGIAHDLNNVLAIILGRSELILSLLDTAHAARESVETIIRTATRSSKLIKRLLTFTRQGTGEAGPLVVAPLIKEQLTTILAFLPSNVHLEEQIYLNREMIIADPSDIQQITVNLLNNANHAMQPKGGKIEVHLRPVHLANEMVTTTGVLSPGTYILFSVRDTGCGMDDEIKARIFDPFFTTKDVGEGSGLGLPMVHGSVLRAGGQILVQSAPGAGAQFDIYWPQAPSEDLPEAVPDGEVSGTGISVLVIDDLKDFTDLLTMNLQNHGYTVSSFSESADALDFFRHNGNDIDIVIVDFMMPRINGVQLAHALHRQCPDLPIVLLSGYASGITSENAHEHGFCAMFEKPLEIDCLSRRLAQLVRSSSTGM